MKNSILFTPIIFLLFGFLNSSFATDTRWQENLSADATTVVCNTPSALTTTNITETSATFNWSEVPGAVSYSVQIRWPNGTWTYVPGSPFDETFVMVNGLSPGTTYEWRVRTNCNFGEASYWSVAVSFTTDGTVNCTAPTWLETFNIGQTTATWDWSPVSGALNYSVQWRYAGGTWNNLSGGPWSGTLLNVGGLSPGTAYEWRVRSNCGYGVVSDWSIAESFTTLTSACATPTGLNTTNITGNSATFNWNAVAGAQSYSVQIRWPNGTWTYISGSPFNNTSATVTNLNPATTYEWRVRANCSNGDYSYWSAGMTFTTTGSASCSAPDWLGTFNVTQTTATWDWNPAPGAWSYSVQWRYAGGTWNNLSGGPWSGTLLNVGGLTPGTAYEWRVRSNCSNGVVSDWSVASAFTTLSGTCTTPTGTHTTNITESSATFNWNAVAGAQSYSVQIRLPWGAWQYISGSPFNGTSATAYGLSAGTTYEWRVRANCGYGYSSNWTSPISFNTVGSSTCIAPDFLYTANITSTTATWDWSSVPGAVNYTVQWRYAGGTWYNLPGGPFYGTLLNIGGLQPGTAYEWRVRSNCSNGQSSAWSVESAFTTLGGNCAMPTGTVTSNITETSAMFNWDAVSGAQSYSVQIRLPNGSWSFLPNSPFYGTSATATGLTPGVTYEWRVRANCGYNSHSLWTTPVSFTTGGSGGGSGNDNCSNAMVLTVNDTCNFVTSSTVNATPSVPAPAGGCSSTNYKDVWFKFTMPNVQYPTVTIRTEAGSLADAVMEVYIGNSCGSLSFLTCEDDNNNGNGSNMPVINLSGGPNITVWVRVWGFEGSTGTFNICVLDYETLNLAEVPEDIIPLTGDVLEKPELFVPAKDVELTPSYLVSPNPASDFLRVMYVQSDASHVTDLVITDMSGKVMVKNEYQSDGVTQFEEQVDVSGLAPGIYLLQIVTTSGIVTEKISVID